MAVKRHKDNMTLGGKAPEEFRIWRAGLNETEHGPVYFTEESAKLITDWAAQYGNRLSIDYNHMSVSDVPVLPEATKAAGWHDLEVREGELWAVRVEWTPTAKAGIEAPVPEWRYISPCYDLRESDNVVVAYHNLALCINPATRNCTKLATKNKVKNTMSKDEILAALAALEGMELSDEARAFVESLKAKLAQMEQEEAPASEAPKMDEMPQEEPKQEAPKMDASDPKEEPKNPYMAKADTLALAKKVAELEAKIARDEVTKVVRDNLGKKIPASLKDWAMSQSMDTLKAFLKDAPVLNMSAPKVEKDSLVKTSGKGADEISVDRALGLFTTIDPNAPVGFVRQQDSGVYRLAPKTPSQIRSAKK